MSPDLSILTSQITKDASAEGLDVVFSIEAMASTRADVKSPYLLVAVDLNPADVNLEFIAQVLRWLVSWMIGRRVQESFGGIEVLSRSVRNDANLRLARLSILPSGLQSASTITASALRLSEPAHGVFSKIYLDELRG
jgi:hypothetical protein